jgi:quercetin dioxygenase-like cupin family protein
MSPANHGKTLEVLGPRINFLSRLEIGEDEFTLIAGTLDPGVIVPLHSHPDRELFSITDGVLEAFVADQWRPFGAGDVPDIRDGVRHAWRNTSGLNEPALAVSIGGSKARQVELPTRVYGLS